VRSGGGARRAQGRSVRAAVGKLVEPVVAPAAVHWWVEARSSCAATPGSLRGQAGAEAMSVAGKGCSGTWESRATDSAARSVLHILLSVPSTMVVRCQSNRPMLSAARRERHGPACICLNCWRSPCGYKVISVQVFGMTTIRFACQPWKDTFTMMVITEQTFSNTSLFLSEYQT